MGRHCPIIVLVEHDRGEMRPVTWEGLALAREIQRVAAAPIQMVFVGDPVIEAAKALADRAGENVLAIQTPGRPEYHPEGTLKTLADHFQGQTPAYFIVPHTSRAWELAPRLAVRLKLPCLTGITRVVPGEGRPGFLKPLYGGKLNARMEPECDGGVLTFEPGYFKLDACYSGHPGSWTAQTAPAYAPPSELLEKIPARETGADLRSAETIVAAGRGIGRIENLELIRSLAGQFPRSAVAGSRPLCDQGWLKYAQQVGLTGTTVIPRLYLACGISGAYQHVAGMKDSGFIVAINRDPRAAILNWSDLAVIEDLESFLPLLIEAIQKIRGH